VEEEEDMDETLREEDYEDEDVDEDEQLVQRIVASTKAAILKARGGKDDYQKKGKGSSHGGANREKKQGQKKESPFLPGDLRRCLRCKGWGHFAIDCPTAKEVDLNQLVELAIAGEPILRDPKKAPASGNAPANPQ
jgi:hypothetical protein